MRHRIKGRQFGRTKDQRRALFKNLASELIMHGRISTTVAKAKTIKPIVDKLVTKGKKATLVGRREISGFLPKETANFFLTTVIPRFANRTSGFSRIIHLGQQSGDNAPMAILEWVEQMEVKSEKLKVKSEKEEKKKDRGEIKEETKNKKKKIVRKRKVVEKKK